MITRCLTVPEQLKNEGKVRADGTGRAATWTGCGGHFAALEAPDLLTADVREFFRTVT